VAEQHLKVTGLTKSFGSLRAVDEVSFEVNQGELITLLGPSGCGKTTTLRMLAGLERPDAGEVCVKDRLVSSAERRIFLPPEKRGMGMVFQSYAVWPHMTVFENVAFPLHARGVSAAERRGRGMAALETVGLAGFADRPAPQLSGGQQQRVALARAIVSDPAVLLLDEPFSNLDARLRDEMRLELRGLQRRLGVTSVFVTHDQTEAMMLSDRVLVMNTGRVEQEGTPREVYESPRSPFVMDFLGQVSHLPAVVARTLDGQVAVRAEDGPEVLLPHDPVEDLREGEAVVLAFRSADVELTQDGRGTWQGTVASVVYLGGREEYLIRIGSANIRAERARARLGVGTPVGVSVPGQLIRVWRSHLS
jgi:iron(III) transport system ATP-binding protein